MTTDPNPTTLPLDEWPTEELWAALRFKIKESKEKIERLHRALSLAESEARRYADFYPQASDARNTFGILADRIAAIAKEHQS